MAYRSKAVFLPDAAELVAESLEGGREAESEVDRLRYGQLRRQARYELVEALRDGAIEAEGEHRIASNDGFRRLEIRKVSRVWWAQAVVEPPLHVDLWKPGRVYVMWSGHGALVIGPWCSPPPAGSLIDGATWVGRISLEQETLLAIWPIAELSQGRTSHSAITSAEVGAEPSGREAVGCETTNQKTATHRKGGRKPDSGAIDDSADLVRMAHLLASKKSPSVWHAAGTLANGREAVHRRLSRKFSTQWGTEPPPGKTWEDVKRDVERELNTN